MSVSLIFKSPTLSDLRLDDVPLTLTISELKQTISITHPTEPRVELQKLIFGGKILQDHLTLSTILVQVGRMLE
jgi:hypothetical protein